MSKETASPLSQDGSAGPIRLRLGYIDALRGLVIVLMALDHSRDFFGDVRIRPEDPNTTTLALFVTRWITHFCAPTFVLLAGASAWLYRDRNPEGNLSWFLFSRGVWLLVLEQTVVYFGLGLSWGVLPSLFLVLAAIGVSMICLSLLCRLPDWCVLTFGVLVILGHNMLDRMPDDVFGSLSWVWMLIHGGPGFIPWANLEVGYPFLPWLGVMAIGFGAASVLKWPQAERLWLLKRLGLAMIVGFILLRINNGYGDPVPWETIPHETILGARGAATEIPGGVQGIAAGAGFEPVDFLRTAYSFLGTSKYPPSMLYLLMTLGPALLLLAYLDQAANEKGDQAANEYGDQAANEYRLLEPLAVYGRVPLFFYLIHFYLLHLGAIGFYWLVKGVPLSPFQAIYGQSPERPLPPEFGFSGLWQVYLAWIVLLAVMYPLCVGFGRLKKNGKSPVWSYL